MSDEKSHAIVAPSKAYQVFICAGSVLMEQGIPDVENEYARQGTAGHEYASIWLTTGMPPVLPWTATNGVKFSNDPAIDGDLIDAIREYVESLQASAAGRHLLVEQEVPIGQITGEAKATGTADGIVFDDEVIEVNDLKLGMGVKVYAKKNWQLMFYALGVLYKFAALGDWQRIILRIHQPRLGHLDEWECTREELDEFADFAKLRASVVWRLLSGELAFDPDKDLVPTEKGCMWCKAKATCPALAAHTFATISGQFEDLTKNPVAKLSPALEKLNHATNEQLSWYMQNLGLIEDWIKAVRAKTEAELFAGHVVPGFKIVAGKKGNRKWTDEATVEAKLKAWKTKPEDMYKTELLSPKAAETLFKKKHPAQWAELVALYTQSEGSPSVAPSTDPRPILKVGAQIEDFDVITDESK